MQFFRRLFGKPLFWSAALVAYCLALVVATHLPSRHLVFQPTRIDKFVHLVAFAGLAGLLAMAWQSAAGRLTARHLSAAWLVVAMFAAIDEWTQPLVGRSCSLGDWIADVLGAAAVLVAWTLLQRNNRRSSMPDNQPER